MYNDIFPKEALELYLILKLDTNNSYGSLSNSVGRQ